MLIPLKNKPPKTFNGSGRREVIRLTTVACFNASGVYILLFVAFKSAKVKETHTDNFSVVKPYNIKHIVSYYIISYYIIVISRGTYRNHSATAGYMLQGEDTVLFYNCKK